MWAASIILAVVFSVPNIKGWKAYPRRANLPEIWKSCPEKERPAGGSILLDFILLMLNNLIQGASGHDRKNRRYCIRKLTLFHYVIKRSFESPYLHLESCSNGWKALHKIVGWYHISIVLPLLQKNHRHCSLSSPTGTVCTGKSVRTEWERKLKLIDLCFSWFYYQVHYSGSWGEPVGQTRLETLENSRNTW